MKKILCLIDTLGFGGGAERQMAGLAGLLYQRGFNVDIATYHKHDMNLFLKKKYGIESHNLDCENSQWDKFKKVRRFIKNGRYDTVIAYKDGATKLACLCKLSGLNYHLIVSERNTTTILSKAERVKFFLYKMADYIVPNSYSQGTFICSHFPNLASKIKVITNFTYIHYFTPISYRNNSDKINILVTARIAPQKNIISFMKVIRRMKDNNIPVHFDWYGGVYVGKEEYGKLVKSEYEMLNIADYLSFHKPTRDMVKAYQSCDVFCLPSIHEGYPNVVCEAMSCGKPIICSRICDNPQIIEENINGQMFNPMEEDDMYRVIVGFCSQSKLKLQEMGQESRRIALEKFSEETFVNNYIELLK